MPLMHFGFGGLHREGKHKEQMEMFFEHILSPKLLKSFVCPEFVPIINSPNARWGDPDSAYTTEDGGIAFKRWVKSPPVGLLPCDVPMISFVNVPYKKLKTWTPSEHYGKLGIVFSNEFKKRESVNDVSYYQLPRLDRDPIVIQLNEAINSNNEPTKEKLWNKVLHYRKPSVLWEEFNGLFSTLKVTADKNGCDFEKITYSRYEIGYDFELEKESRIVTGSEGDMVPFREKDVLAIFAPNNEVKSYITTKLKEEWGSVPKVIVYPE